MQHTESSVKVNFTNEYARFKMINGNRQLDEKKIKKIIKEIQSGNNMLPYYPIQVQENNDRLDILDGQHRFYICKKLKAGVYYILVAEKKSMQDIAMVNSNVEKWKSGDFINCYVQHGNENYIKLQSFLDKYGISLGVTLLLLNSGSPGKEGAHPQISEQFRNGTFEVRHLEEAENIANDCMLFNQFANWRSRAFVIAIARISMAGLITIAELLEAYKKKPEMLTQQANYKAYVNTLEQLVNFGKQKRILII